jgi:hypothetical protein
MNGWERTQAAPLMRSRKVRTRATFDPRWSLVAPVGTSVATLTRTPTKPGSKGPAGPCTPQAPTPNDGGSQLEIGCTDIPFKQSKTRDKAGEVGLSPILS